MDLEIRGTGKDAYPVETLPCYMNRGKVKEHKRFRCPVDLAEMINHCGGNSHIWFRTINGDARVAKVNGKVRTWKRDTNRIEVPIKYGMYEYGCLTAADIGRVLIPVL